MSSWRTVCQEHYQRIKPGCDLVCVLCQSTVKNTPEDNAYFGRIPCPIDETANFVVGGGLCRTCEKDVKPSTTP